MFQTSGQFGKLLEKATNQVLMEPDWGAIMQICDLIRQNDVQPRTVLNALKKKLTSPNPHSALYALLVLESIVKNCGSSVHEELTTKAFCEFLHDMVKITPHENVRAKLLELIQAWSVAFRKNPKHSGLKDLMGLMKAEGYKFPAMRESDAMFSADTAPEWIDGEVCHRCRDAFTLLVRKHHCRACGQVFCGKCTSKSTTLPKYGIEKEVRVCDTCYAEVTKPSSKTSQTKSETDLPIEYLKSSLAQQNQEPPKKNEDELREEEELQLALALSQSEAEAKEKEKFKLTSNYSYKAKEIIEQSESAPSPQEEQNSELQRYLNRNFWESRQINEKTIEQNTPASPSAPATAPIQNKEIKYKTKENGVADNDLEEFMKNLKSQVEIFINRMKSNSSRGRSIANDTSVQSLFMSITAMHSQLLHNIQEHDDSRIHFERLQDKLTQVKDARAALDSLREEHLEKLRREAEEAERQRQMQMMHKLEIMRKKKQEFLQYQRQVALQRIQEQEREMHMRQEQQKQQYMIPQYGYISSPIHGQQFPPNVRPPPGAYHTYPYPPHMLPQAQQGGQPPQGQLPQVNPHTTPNNPPGIPQPQYTHTIPRHGHPIPPTGLPGVGLAHQGIVPNQNVLSSNQPAIPPTANLPPTQPGMIPQGQGISQGQGIPPVQGVPQGQGIPQGQIIPQGPGIPSGIMSAQSGIPPNQSQLPLQGQVPPGFQQPGVPGGGQQQPKVEAQTAELISFD